MWTFLQQAILGRFWKLMGDHEQTRKLMGDQKYEVPMLGAPFWLMELSCDPSSHAERVVVTAVYVGEKIQLPSALPSSEDSSPPPPVGLLSVSPSFSMYWVCL